jgi:diaminohydroxyphosphoribosylaminopyrimidine deaminase / 5-amino-6-(5-phosphoribosylamino)uracil reductase
VLDRIGALPATLKLFADEHAARTVAAVGEDAIPAYAPALAAAGGTLLRVPLRQGHLDLRALLAALGQGAAGRKPVQSLLVEAGPRLATALLAEDLVDRLFVFVAPLVLGKGVEAVGDLDVEHMAGARTFAESSWEGVGQDVLFRGFLREV